MGIFRKWRIGRVWLLLPVLSLVLIACIGKRNTNANVGGEAEERSPAPDSTPARYTLGGHFNGLSHSSVQISMSGEVIMLSGAPQSFQFTREFQSGESYMVLPTLQPSAPALSCTVENAVGAFSTANITSVSVNCPQVMSVTVSSAESSIPASTTSSMSARALYDDGSFPVVTNLATWSSSDEAVATVLNGNVSGVGGGTATLSAAFGGQTGSQSLTVVAATLNSLSLSSGTTTLGSGTTTDFQAFGHYSDGSVVEITDQVTWTSTTPSVATVDDTTNKGRVEGVSAGSSNIQIDYESLTESRTVTVTAATLDSLDLSPVLTNTSVGSSLQFVVTGVFSDASTQDLTSVATLGLSDNDLASWRPGSDGLLDIESAGSLTVTATYGGQSDSSVVNISAATLDSLSIIGGDTSVPASFWKNLSVIGTYSDASTEDLTEQVFWSSDTTAVATISNAAGAEGRVSGVSAGSAVITASLSGVSTTITLTVTSATLSNIVVSPEALMFPQGVDPQLYATGTFSDASELDLTEQVTWSSSDNSVATISNVAGTRGLINSLYVGAATQSLTMSAQTGAVSGTMNFIITPASLVSLTMDTLSWTDAPFTDRTLKVYGVYDDGAATDLSSVAAWTSDDDAVADVSNATGNKGNVVLLSEGTASITAGFNSLHATSDVASSTIDPSTEETPGIGLKGEYHSGNNFETKVGERIDATIDFNWSQGSAPLGVNDNFSLRWTGQVEAEKSENYTFCTWSDDGVRAWVDGVLVIDNWTLHSARKDCSSNIALTAGERYDIQVEFFENGGHARIELYWQSSTTPEEIVPQEFLYPE